MAAHVAAAIAAVSAPPAGAPRGAVAKLRAKSGAATDSKRTSLSGGRGSRESKGGDSGHSRGSGGSSSDEGVDTSKSNAGASARKAQPRKAGGAVPGLPPRATPLQLLAHASCDSSAASLLAEAVFEYDFATKAAIINEVLARASAAAALARARNLPPGVTRLGSTPGLRGSPALEAFARSLGAAFHRLRLPEPRARIAAPPFAKLTWEKTGYENSGVFAKARTVSVLVRRVEGVFFAPP